MAAPLHSHASGVFPPVPSRLSQGPPLVPPSRMSQGPPPPPISRVMSSIKALPPGLEGPPPLPAPRLVVEPPPGMVEPPPGLTTTRSRAVLIPQGDQVITVYVGNEDKWDNQSVSSFTSTATNKSQANMCRCEKCKERRRSHRQSGTGKHRAHKGRRHHRKSLGRRVSQVVLFPFAGCIST